MANITCGGIYFLSDHACKILNNSGIPIAFFISQIKFSQSMSIWRILQWCQHANSWLHHTLHRCQIDWALKFLETRRTEWKLSIKRVWSEHNKRPKLFYSKSKVIAICHTIYLIFQRSALLSRSDSRLNNPKRYNIGEELHEKKCSTYYVSHWALLRRMRILCQ